ncbi:MAG: hypothetical protein ACO1TE_15220 [Prosthecobacter sp.]
MSQPSLAENDSTRRSRTRRRETMLNAIATILGCLALVVMIATVVRVVMVKLWESAKVNPEYVQSVYDSAHERQLKAETFSTPSRALEDIPASPTAEPAPARGSVLPVKAENQATETHFPATTDKNSSRALAVPLAGPTSIQDIEGKRLQIEATLRGFFEASTVESKLSYVRDAARVRPLMDQYHNGRPPVRHQWKGLGWVLPVEEPGFRLGYAQAMFADAEPVSLIIEEKEDGTFRVDWESSVRYGELDWSEFIETQPTAPKLFRVIASRPRHSPSTEAPQGSEVLEIKHPDDDNVIYAYFDRQDPKFQSLLQQLQTGNWKDVPLTLRLCYTGPSNGGKSVRIADIEGKGWLILQGTRS